jgi:hypothetical protein
MPGGFSGYEGQILVSSNTSHVLNDQAGGIEEDRKTSWRIILFNAALRENL